MPTEIRRYVRALGLDAYVVGGAVRDELLGIQHADEDFLVLGVTHEDLRAALARYGRVEEMEVHGQLVGVRLHPRDRAVARLAPAGIELTPPRRERSTGPGHGDFEIVVDPDVGIEEDMRRRDFTVNAMARSLATGALVDPFGGLADLGRRELRTVSQRSFVEDPLRLLRGLRLVSQLGLTPSGETLAQMRVAARGLEHVSSERIGGGVAADGMGELSKLLMGREPDRALRLARETGVLTVVIPEFGAAIGYSLGSRRQPLPLDEHLFSVVRALAERDAPLEVRLAALLHDLGKPATDASGGDHAAEGAELAGRILARLRYPTATQREVGQLVRAHAFGVELWLGPDDGGRATRRFLLSHGLQRARWLVLHKEADLATKHVPDAERRALARLGVEIEHQASAPHRVADLAVDGSDLLAVGYGEGPVVGRTLAALLDAVVDDPSLNERETLLARAEELRP